MFQIASYESYADGQAIFEEGSHGDWIYLLDEGVVEISKTINGEKVIIETLHPGDIFGEMAYLAKTPRSATARAVGQVTVGILDRTFFDTEFNKLSGDFQAMLKTVAMRLKKTTESYLEAKAEKTS